MLTASSDGTSGLEAIDLSYAPTIQAKFI